MDTITERVEAGAADLLIHAKMAAGEAAREKDGRKHPSMWTLTEQQLGYACFQVATIARLEAEENVVHEGRMEQLAMLRRDMDELLGKPMLRAAQGMVKGTKKKSFEIARVAKVKLRKQQHKLTEVEPDAVRKWVMLNYPEFVVRVVTSEKLSQDELESFIAAMEALPEKLVDKISWKTSWPKKVLTDHLKGTVCGSCGNKGCKKCGFTGGEIPGGCTAIAADDRMYIDPVLAVVAAPKQLEQGLTTDDILPSPVNEGEEVLPL